MNILFFVIAFSLSVYLLVHEISFFRFKHDLTKPKKRNIVPIIVAISGIIAISGNEWKQIYDSADHEKELNVEKLRYDSLYHSLNNLRESTNLQIKQLMEKNDSIFSFVAVKGYTIHGNDNSNIELRSIPKFNKDFKISKYYVVDIPINAGDKIIIHAYGNLLIGPVAGYSSPIGRMDFGLYLYSIVSSIPHAALMFRYSDDNNWVCCGTDYSFTASHASSLIFAINDKHSGDNSGFYYVNLKVFK